MRIKFSLGTTIFLLLFSITAHSELWRQIATGVSYRKLTIATDTVNVNLYALKTNLKQAVLHPILSKHPSSAKTMAETTGAIATINANFFDATTSPLGLVVSAKKSLHPVKVISWWGVFCVSGGVASVFTSSSYQDGICDEAIEAGPRLVVNGDVVAKLKDEHSRKTAIGITPQGEVILVASDLPITTTRLANVLRTPESQGGLGCVNALNLDGGSSSQIFVKAGDFELNMPGFAAVPVGLGVFRK